jgi:hypothetical protein
MPLNTFPITEKYNEHSEHTIASVLRITNSKNYLRDSRQKLSAWPPEALTGYNAVMRR